ncbi:MAG TPA: SLBB domain-containing protein [Candidatus Acidoferrales bacterium]|nr:SLBB domain-containing protein [Candidatus Acidoferrales bacterium]
MPAQFSQKSSAAARASGLAEDNLDRVAARAADIQAILRSEPGLMVEVKHLVAKQATENGQIVKDADLTDDAIFNRLGTDIPFRARVTRLLQQYGYLVPKPNPGSTAAMEQALVVQEHLYVLQANLRAQEQQELPPQMEKSSVPNIPPNPSQRQQSEPLLQTGTTPPPTELPLPSSVPLNTSNPLLLQTPTPSGGALRLPTQDTSGTLTQASLGTNPQLPPGFSGESAANWPTPEASAQNEKAVMNSELLERSATPASVAPAVYGTSEGENENREAAVGPEMRHEANPYAGIPSLYDMYDQYSPNGQKLARFGINIFGNGATRINQLPTDLPAGPDYVVGPGDGLTIDTWGSVSQRLYRVVDREGRLALPEIGPVQVSGRNLGEVQQEIQQALRTQYRSISADVSIARLRSVRVYVVGDVEHPGAYDVSSLSTPLNALLQAGGPTHQGSLRILDHYRGNQLVQDVDVYDLLLRGVRSGIERLEDGDTVLVPPIGPEITVEGMVRRPARYELKGEKTLADALALAGGILPTAALGHIEVQRVVAHEQHTMLSLEISDANNPQEIEKQLESFAIQDGDVVNIFPIAPYNQAAIYLEGHVLRPGKYSYQPGMKLTDLVSSYKDLLPEPAGKYAEIIRLNPPDYHPSVIAFNLDEAIAHPSAAPTLDPMDTVRIFSAFDFANAPSVSIGGAVRNPGSFTTPGQVRLSDAIHLAGGVTPDALMGDAQVYRYLPNSELKVMDVNLGGALDGNAEDNILLEPRDRIVVHQNPAKVDPPSVFVQGEVAKPGRFPLSTNLRVGDAIRLAGGFKRSADTADADLTRYVVQNQKQLIGKHQEINLTAALSGDPQQDLVMRDGDVLTIRQVPGWNDIGASVSLQGEVVHPGVYGIKPGERLSSVLERAGGFLPTAYPQGTVLESVSVRDLQQKSRDKLIQEIKQDSANFKADNNASAQERADLQQASLQQHQQEIQALEQAPVSGRVVVRIPDDLKHFHNSPDDVELRDDDSIFIPKRPDFVLVTGQVYNTNAITYVPGRDAGWYLSQAGGPTNLANKKSIFIIRANGGVVTGHTEGWWSGNVLSTRIAPGDTIVVPERPVGGSTTWKNLLSIAQVAQAGAMSAFVFTR